MTPPVEFTARLRRDFGQRLRLRWSDSQHQWLVEQKVGRAAAPARPGTEMEDRWVQARDGYALVLTVAPGDRERCQHCGETVRLPVYDFRETACPRCGKLTRSCHWQLNDQLLEHLRRIDPMRDGPRRMARDADRATHAAEQSRIRANSNETESIIKDAIGQIGGFTTVGYTGKEIYQE